MYSSGLNLEGVQCIVNEQCTRSQMTDELIAMENAYSVVGGSGPAPDFRQLGADNWHRIAKDDSVDGAWMERGMARSSGQRRFSYPMPLTLHTLGNSSSILLGTRCLGHGPWQVCEKLRDTAN